MSTYPSAIGTLPNPNPTDRLNNPSHSALHQSENAEIIAIETFVGTLSSAQGSLVYDVRSPNSNGGGHVQTANTGGTGQTAYIKGDLLVAQSNSVLARLAVGNDGQALIANSSTIGGVTWGSSSNPRVRTYTFSSITSGSSVASLVAIWYKPSVFSYIVVEGVGAGGGGGGNNTSTGGGAGGGAGGYFKKTILASGLPLAASVILGVNGTGGITSGNGAPGGPTLFGSILTGFGGSGGGGPAPATGGNGGSASGGDINAGGQTGVAGTGNSAGTILQGIGGASFYAGGDGAGGSGGRGNSAGGSGNGGSIIVTEY